MATRRAGTIGIQATLKQIRSFEQSMNAEIADVVSETADAVLDSAQRSMRNTSNGQIKGGRPVSQPGEAPNVDSGELVNSLGVDYRGTVADVYTNDFKAAWLEFGIQQMPARPFLGPALQRNRFEFFKKLRGIVEIARKRSGQ
ncbi:hypothetical protein CAL18_12405 [Bordetella genomosp. 7]|nr:hypothetical protein CAL18_12405 [Bordetella genomosp. 7]